ncbi:MAG: hypothetical protein ACOCTS_02230 [Thermodesulfobacteriota bacterium]
MPQNPAPLRIGLKYCGGCKPTYDRVALVDDIKERLGNRVEFVPADSADVSLILAVQGCPTACADLSAFRETPVWSITGPEEAEAFIEHIRKAGIS